MSAGDIGSGDGRRGRATGSHKAGNVHRADGQPRLWRGGSSEADRTVSRGVLIHRERESVQRTRRLRRGQVMALVAAVSVGLVGTAAFANAWTHSPADPQGLTVGAAFRVDRTGLVSSAQVYVPRSAGSTGVASIWDSNGNRLARTTVASGQGDSWAQVAFATPVPVTSGTSYVVTYWSTGRGLHRSHNGSNPPVSGAVKILDARRSVGDVFPTTPYPSKWLRVIPVWVTATWPTRPPTVPPTVVPVTPTTKPTMKPSPTITVVPSRPATPPVGTIQPPNNGTFPGPNNTGVPAGVKLDTYSGPMTITRDGTVIDGKLIHGHLVISATDVVVKNSKLIGDVDSDSDHASVTVMDSEVDNGDDSSPAIGYSHVTVLRSNVHGGQHSVLCSDQCVVEGSWLHGQGLPADQSYHNNAFISNGGTGIKLLNNTLECTPRDNHVQGGCTADVSLFGDFAPIRQVQISGNLFKATPGGYCGTFGYNSAKPYGRSPSDISVTNNVFEHGAGSKCGYWGPVTGFMSGSGDVWSGNSWIATSNTAKLMISSEQ